MYDEKIVQPMRDEMIAAGFAEARTPEAVDAALAQESECVLMFINSVCGCSAGVARPGMAAAIQHPLAPNIKITAFGGNDKDAVSRMRDHFIGYPPSSPCAGLFRDGELVFMLERHQIEGNTAENVQKVMESAFERYCGPDIDLSKPIYDPIAAFLIEPTELRPLLGTDQVTLLDVREDSERAALPVDGALPVTNELANEIVSSWDKARKLVVICQHGTRSLAAAQYLRNQGFKDSWSLRGGAVAL